MSTRAEAQIVIVGAGAAGDAAAMALRKNGFDGSVVLIGAELHRPYERPYLSKQYLRDELPIDRVFLRRPEEYERQRIEFLSGQRVVEASRRERDVILADGRRITFDTLILAPGGIPRWPPDVPRLANVFSLRTLDDTEAIKEALSASQRLLLLGAGFIGAEVAASARTM